MIKLFTDIEYNQAKADDKLPLQCIVCGKTFYCTKKHITREIKYNLNTCRFCSISCHYEDKRKGVKSVCSFCGKEIYVPERGLKKSKTGNFYCSKKCGNLHKNLLREQSGEWKDSYSTYRKRALNHYEKKCFCCGWEEDERILEVHHIDEDRNNNDIDNLCILCPTCHRKITLGYYILDIKNKCLLKK